MKALVIGMGVSGLSMARYLTVQGATVCAVDNRDRPPCLEAIAALNGVTVYPSTDVTTWTESHFAAYTMVAKSPGVPLSQLAAPRTIITGDAALFAAAWRQSPPQTKLLAVTGTNGKSTVTALSAQLCAAAGWRAEAIGNIGEPLLAAWMRWQETGAPDVAVAELSSFQLETASAFFCDAAVVLNISPDHLDHHADMSAYVAAKSNIYKQAKCRVVNVDDTIVATMVKTPEVTFSSRQKASWRMSDGVIWGDSCFDVKEVNAPPQNALAALALTDNLSINPAARRQALAEFVNLPHRRQTISCIGGVTYINDSKATNVASTCFALRQLSGEVVLIAGGDGKGQNFADLAAAAQRRVRMAILLGKDTPRLQEAFAAVGIAVQQAENMAIAVQLASSAATTGDVVLLSPACSSQDMYANYEKRGSDFVACLHLDQTCAAQ